MLELLIVLHLIFLPEYVECHQQGHHGKEQGPHHIHHQAALVLLDLLSLLKEAPHNTRSNEHAHTNSLGQDDNSLPLHT